MKQKDLIKILQEEEIHTIDYEKYNGETIVSLSLANVDIADVEEGILRLQLNKQ